MIIYRDCNAWFDFKEWWENWHGSILANKKYFGLNLAQNSDIENIDEWNPIMIIRCHVLKV